MGGVRSKGAQPLTAGLAWLAGLQSLWAGPVGWAVGLGCWAGLGCWVALLCWGAGLGCWAWLLAWAVGRVFGPGCGLGNGQGLRPWQADGPLGWAAGLGCWAGLMGWPAPLGRCIWRLAGLLGLAAGWAISWA